MKLRQLEEGLPPKAKTGFLARKALGTIFCSDLWHHIFGSLKKELGERGFDNDQGVKAFVHI